MKITSEKLNQAESLLNEKDIDLWLTFVRETADGGDPALPLILEGGLTWQSALIVSRTGKRVAVVGNYDADPLIASGDWHTVIPYTQSIREPLLKALESLHPSSQGTPRLAVNFSENDPKADGLTHGMFHLLKGYLQGTVYEAGLMSAEPILIPLRSRKTPTELARIRSAIAETHRLFEEVSDYARVGLTERAVYDFIQVRMSERNLGYAWDKAGDPIVNAGPESMGGHGVPSETLHIQPGQIFHIDLGVIKEGYSSDLQRCWYVSTHYDAGIPEPVQHAFWAVTGAITAGADALKPGVMGWEVDAIAREFIKEAGYPEYMHALGHQVGRMAHDGGGILGPRWERYGETPMMTVEAGQVYTLELGVFLKEQGYLGIEEMIVVHETGVEWLSERQEQLWILKD